jgi:hypothetical protein
MLVERILIWARPKIARCGLQSCKAWRGRVLGPDGEYVCCDKPNPAAARIVPGNA